MLQCSRSRINNTVYRKTGHISGVKCRYKWCLGSYSARLERYFEDLVWEIRVISGGRSNFYFFGSKGGRSIG